MAFRKPALPLLVLTLLMPSIAFAHASEQAFVLLLPTGVYITSGVLAVVLTIVLLAFLPRRSSTRLWNSKRIWNKKINPAAASGPATDKPSFTAVDVISLASLALLLCLLLLGIFGSHDPLKNPLPLFIWTIWWIGFVLIQGLLGNIWRYVNPWTGLYRLITKSVFHSKASDSTSAHTPRFKQFVLAKYIGVWPGIVVLVLFMLFALADIAPDAPTRLALVVSVYWLLTFLGMLVFGECWLTHAECFTILLYRYSQLSLFGTDVSSDAKHVAQVDDAGKKESLSTLKLGFPGWQAMAKPTATLSGSVFILVLLGTGSFDGFNETFYWLSLIGINPLEFPGRSAVVMPTVVGLMLANIALILVYAICVFAGVVLANRQQEPLNQVSFTSAFTHLAIAILPIAFTYHFAHFLTAFMINAQYALAALSDPLDTGADLLGLGTFYVTTGFMNSHHTVEAIWLSQAIAVVFGHVLSVLLAHALALDLFGSTRRAIISQAPLAVFMVVYTFIGLWLLAAPRGA